jgi:putative Holliday junction resolvase
MKKRIMALDYGSKTVGVAVTDGLGLTAVSVGTIKRDRENQLRATYRRIKELIDEYDVGSIVIGLPLNMDGTESDRSILARRFGEDLSRRTGLSVVMQDERLTTVEADEIMSLTGSHKGNRKDRIDAVAAAVILTDYLGQHTDEQHNLHG